MVLVPPPPRSTGATDENFHWMSLKEERQAFDEQVRTLLNISGQDFLRLLDSGFYENDLDDTDHSDVMYLSMLAEIAR